MVVDAARHADEYGVLYKPFKMEQASSQKWEHVPDSLTERGHFFTIRRRGVDLTKDLIYEALHTASVVQDVIVMDILHRTVIQLSQL